MPELPPAKVLQPLLRKLTERLANALARPDDTTVPDWSEFEWRMASGVAALHGVSPLLARVLKWEGPAHWQSFLEDQRTHVVARHRRIEGLLTQLDIRSREDSVAFVALKGAALHATGVYQCGDRPMADVDLLVHPRDGQRAASVLESLGFNELFANWKHQVFAPTVRDVHPGMGEHANNYLKIELHHRIAEILPFRISDVTDSVLPRHPHPGLNAYPSRAALLIHLLIHAASAMAYRSLRLLHLNDIALLGTRMSNSDWAELLEYGGAKGGPWWALPPLQLTARYYATAIPTDVLTALETNCPWTLRQLVRHQLLSDVSLSYPWVEAFPGICWCRSITETFEYIRSRAWPSSDVLRLRKVGVKTQVAGAESEWARLSQGRRMLKWITSRPTRPDTLHVVRSAMAAPHPL
jgi:hypothetical protein